MKKNNIVWLHTHFLFWMGGTKFVHHILNELKKSKKIKKIVVIVENTSDFSKLQYKNINIELVSLESFTSNSPFYWLFLPFFLFKNLLKIKKILYKNNFNKENCTIYSGMFPMNVIAVFLGLRHVQNCFEPFAFFYDSNFTSQFSLLKILFIKILKFLYSPLDKWSVKKADTVLTLNSTTQKMIREVYGVDSIKTQAGVDSKLFRPYVSKEIASAYKNKVIAIHSTDYSPIKGTDLVIKAFAKAAKKIPNALLIVTSTIENEQKKEELIQLASQLNIQSQIKFVGFLPISELPQYYSIAKVMVQGAFSEKSGTTSMSLPVKEAMCCGTPAIRPDIGGEDVVDNKSGFLVDPRNTSKMAKKISILLTHPNLSKNMGQVARKFILKKYTWKNSALIFLEYQK